MPKGRPGGNPDLVKYHFKQKYDWDEPCTSRLVLRVPESMKLSLKEINGWQEIVRKAIAVELEKEKKKQKKLENSQANSK
jgi:hypothetical protein